MVEPLSAVIGATAISGLFLVHQYGVSRGDSDAREDLVDMDQFVDTLQDIRAVEAVRNDADEAEDPER